MTPEGIARIRACFANAEQVLPIGKAISLSNCIANEKFVGAIGTHLEG